MKKLFCVLIIVLMFSACSSPSLSNIDIPEGYRITCSLDGHKYSFYHPNGMLSPNVFDSKKEAIEFIIYYDRTIKEPIHYDSDDYEWTDCNN